ncbi:MAG: M42 family metallopeptidase [Eubacteriales bacterium]|nr:M42 family metallopeptidase [Eubacteriales bacterium]
MKEFKVEQAENREYIESMGELAEQAIDKMQEICEIGSPSGFTHELENKVMAELKELGFKPWQSVKRGVWCCLDKNCSQADAKPEDDALLLAAHIDTLGLMVRYIKPNGKIRLTIIGGYPYNYVEQENVTVVTRSGKRYEGSVHLTNPAVHATREANSKLRNDETMELILDEQVESAEDVRALGIEIGDYVILESRARRSGDGFFKSRHLDDKASAAMLLVLAREVAEGRLNPAKKVYIYFSNYEEVGNGAAAGHPVGIRDMIAVDMGVVGDDLETNEYKLSICPKDSSGPYDYFLTDELIKLAEKRELEYCLDIYPFYVSDASCAREAGYDYRFALCGTGVARSHGYERIHKRGVQATIGLLHALIAGEEA